MGIILLNHCYPLMNKKKRNKTNPTLSIGAALPTESPQQEGIHVTPQVFASCLSGEPTSVRWVKVNCRATKMSIFHRLRSSTIYTVFCSVFTWGRYTPMVQLWKLETVLVIVQGCTANKWQSQDLNSDNSDSKPIMSRAAYFCWSC